MKLPKSVTTVTTFSKTLAMILFIFFPFAGFYFGMTYQAKLDSTKLQTLPLKETKVSPTQAPVQETSCNSNADCQSEQRCMTIGPIIAGQSPHKMCVSPGQAVPL